MEEISFTVKLHWVKNTAAQYDSYISTTCPEITYGGLEKVWKIFTNQSIERCINI